MTGQQIDRDRLRELAENATPGPWKAARNRPLYGSAYYSVDAGDELVASLDLAPDAAGPQASADSDFIAAARTALPQLLDMLGQAEQRIRDLTQEVQDERAACLDQIEQVQARDARIKAVEDVLDTWMTYCQTEQTARALSDIRRALDGER